MRYLKKYQIFESDNNLDNLANQFVIDMSKIYDLRFGQPFDKNKANCAWFTIQFFNWAKSKGLDVRVVYFDSDVEAHIAPLVNGKVFDFAVKQFTKNPNDNYLISNPKDYQKWGYQSFEIYDELPKLETVFPADKINEGAETGDKMYGIHDWIEDLKSWEWNRSGTQPVTFQSIKKWSDYFIGEGWYDKIESLVDKMFDSINKVDVEYINDRMYDVYDLLPSEKEKYTMCCIAYGDVENYDKSSQYKYNGLLSVRETDDKTKMRIIISIIKDIVFPTLNIGSYPSYFLRQSDESYYVTDKKWQCQNFNIDDYKEMGIYAGATFKGDERRSVTITERDIKELKEYSIPKILEMYKPCVTINIGGHHDSRSTGKMNLLKLESNLDEVLPTILPTLDYEEVIFDVSRGNRGFDTENYEVYDYTVKILLKF